MTEGAPEPTLHDVLTAIRALATGQDALAGKVDELALNFAAYTQLAESRHVETAQALEAVSGLVHGQQHALAQSEARVLSRIDDVQQVVQKLKADLAAHVSDTQVHRDAHGTAA